MKTDNIPARLVLSVHLYQMLLAMYPAEFRQYYGEPMLQVFGDCCRQALREAGTTGLIILWWRTLIDTVKTAIEEHTQRGTYMFKSKFVKLSGWALIIGSLAILLGWLAGSRPEYSPYNYVSLPIDRLANAAIAPLMIMSFTLIVIGFIGLLLRYGRRAGRFGRYSLIFGIVSGGIGIAGLLLLMTTTAGGGLWDWTMNSYRWWLVFIAGGALQFLGLVFFGIDSLRQCILPRWNGLPILAGLWLPIFLIATTAIELITGVSPSVPVLLIMLVIFLTVVGLAGLGYLLQADSQPADLTAATA